MKTYLIDGYNLGHKIPRVVEFLKAQDFQSAIEHIIHFVQQKIKVQKHRVIIVFDGKKGVFAHPAISTRIEIKFSRKPLEADDLIRDFLRKCEDTSDVVVVSSDRAIINTCKDLGAQSIRSDEFARPSQSKVLQSTNSEASEKPDPDRVDLDYWLEQFQNNRDDED